MFGLRTKEFVVLLDFQPQTTVGMFGSKLIVIVFETVAIVSAFGFKHQKLSQSSNLKVGRCCYARSETYKIFCFYVCKFLGFCL